MLNKIKIRLEANINKYVLSLDKLFALNKISSLLSDSIKDFLSRKGKRIRPILFVVSYLGFANKPAKNLYSSALSLELLHNFMLIHDDIIDNSAFRRGRPSMHIILEKALKENKNRKFSGKELAIVLGDVMYAMGVNAFLSIKEDALRKEMALGKFSESAIYTGSGEFIELLYGLKDISAIKKEDIYKIYDLKTANYTFSTPLALGAILAGADPSQVKKLIRYGIYLGRAFQIKDDMLDMFGKKADIGKSNLTDIKEAKKTLLLWYAYNNSPQKNKSYIRKTLKKIDSNFNDLIRMRKIVKASGALGFVKKETEQLLKKAEKIGASLKMRPEYKNILDELARDLLIV